MRDLKRWVSREYPWIAAVNESMLLTDVRKPDCPIVQANIEFEMMTGYPSAEILGRNCRFLQGAGTNSAIVARIRNAVVNGSELSVEILNYTKYGVPFVNAFTMYPIHRGGVANGELRYFLAIQKNVMHIKQLSAPPAQWSTHEVVIWLDRAKILHSARNLVNAAIDGRALLALTDTLLAEQYDITDRTDVDAILNAVRNLQANTSTATATATATTDGTQRYVPVDQERVTRALDWWNTGDNSETRVLVRVYRDGKVDSGECEFLCTASRDTEWSELRSMIESHFCRPCAIKLADLKHVDTDIPMTRALWEQQRVELVGQELTLYAFPQKTKLSRKERAAFEASAAGTLVLNDDRVIFANSTLLNMAHREKDELIGMSIDRVLRNFALAERTSGFRRCFVVDRDGTQIGVLADARAPGRRLTVITTIPLGVLGSDQA
jgi:PAS domain-containing protein